MQSPIESPFTTSLLIERTLHLEALLRIVQELCLGNGQIALIAGEAGIGKTRLLHELRTRLQAAPVAPQMCATFIVQGTCYEPDQALPYAALADLLRRHVAEMPEPDVTAGWRSVARLLPDPTRLFPPAVPDAPEMNKRHFQEDLLAFFIGLSAARPLVMIIEDIHWADEETLEFLALLTRRLPMHPIGLILTYRSDEVGSRLGRFLAALDRTRAATEFNLPHLSKSAVGVMLRAILRLDRPMRADFLETIYTLTDGNPFFVEEVVKSLAARGHLPSEHDRDRLSLDVHDIPRTVQVAVQQRLDRLSSAAQRLARLAAVMGRRFDFELLMRLSGENERSLDEPIRELITAQLIVEESADAFVFRHALTRQAIYAQLLLREQRRLHHAIAQAIEDHAAQSPGGSPPVDDLSEHYYRAEQWKKAADYAQRAGEKALKLYAPHTAVLHYTRAIDALRRVDQPPPVFYSRRGEAYEQVGDFDAARADYESALQAARRAGDVSGEWRGQLALGFLWTSRDFSQAGTCFERAIALARTMDDPKALGSSLNRIGNWHANIERPHDALRYHREALSIFTALSDPHEEAVTLDLLGVTYLMIGDMVNCLNSYHQAVSRWRQLGQRQGLSSSLATMSLAGASVMTDTVYCPAVGLGESVQAGQEALEIAREIGWQAGEAGAQMYLGLGLIARGEYARALELGHNALAVATNIEHQLWIAGAHMLLGRLYLDVFALAQARQHLLHSLAMAQDIGTRFMINANTAFLALLHLAQGQPDESERLLNTMPVLPLQGDGAHSTTQRLVLAARVELALLQGDAPAALQLVDDLLAAAANLGEPSHAIPRLWRLRAEALISLHRFDEAESALQDALRAADLQHVLPLRWRILASLGQLYLSEGKKAEAGHALDEARRCVEQLAQTLDDESLAQMLREGAGALMPDLPTSTPRQTVKAAFDGLTDREREIARLIAEGKSNRDIAQMLYLSKRTVDAHIGNIFGKLGFSSRAQVARWAVEKGLLRSH